MRHTTTRLRVSSGKGGEPFSIVSGFRTIALVKSCGNETNGNAHLLAKAFNSYSKHFGDNAEKAAEDDVLGKLIAAARLTVDNFTRTDGKFLGDDDLAAWNALADALTITKASKP